MSTTIKITYGSDTCTLTCDLAQASAPLVVDGRTTQYQTASARHRTQLAVALACSIVWPEADWPDVPSVGSIPEDWSEGSEAWDAVAYDTVGE